jgi:CubicO group peptidase (beta-lactamase class C family)
MMVEALFRARPFFGQLPVSIDETWKSGWGICISGGHRISRGVLSSPESLNWIKSRNVPNQLTRVYTENYFGESEFAKNSLFHFNWSNVDSIANKGVADGAYPGCRVLVVHKGEIVYDRAYGFLDANKTEPVQLNSVYDLASITKLAGSGLAMMKMMDEHEWSPSGYLGDDLSFPRKSPYAKIKWKDMLSHQAGLKNFIPFHSTLSSNHWLSKTPTENGVQVADSMYTDTILYGMMRDLILKTPLTIPAKYEYSDLGYYFVKEWMEKKTQSPYDIWLSDQFYTPLGLRSMGYLPLNRMSKSRIAPTENDSLFRHQILRGYVHDQGAALMGGVAGHAGLFSNAYDLAVVMQMLMNQGSYGEQQWIKASTVQYFNQRHFPGNRRGLILDKPTLDKVGGSPSSLASHESFGHTGFTGTMCWADPEEELIFIFLSNRIHPAVDNKKLIQQNIRTQLHTEVYKEILLRKDQAK